MRGGLIYSEEENKVLLQELTQPLERKDFESYSEMWPALFQGRRRSPYALWRQMRRLAKRNGITTHFKSIPHIMVGSVSLEKDKSQAVPKKVKPMSKKRRFQLKLETIVTREVRKCARRVARAVEFLVTELLEENQELSQEVRNLVPFKNLVEREFRKQ